MRVEIIAAVRNEEQSLPLFVERVAGLRTPADVELCMTFVEDSSTDKTLEVLRELSALRPEIAYYSLEQGFGQGPAIIFALARCRFDAAILMDADGSHPPEEIPKMIELHRAGAGVVQCVRRALAERSRYRNLGTSLFQALASWLAQVDLGEQSIYYRLVSRKFSEILVSEPRYWRFLRFPLPRGEPELVKIEIDTPERTHDESKYGPLRLAKLAVDAVLSLMSPGRLWSGLAGLALAGLLGLWALGPGGWAFALILAAAGIGLVRRFRTLRSTELLKRMRVRESGNVPECLPGRQAGV